MNMNKALQNLYHAVSGSTTTKRNITKLLLDIHYAITDKESANKNNWSKIVDSMATNWPEGGGDITVEALSVTQNGTYTAPTGKAYSPVTVNVSGGSSDFSTAEVTVNANKQFEFLVPLINDEFGYLGSYYNFNSSDSETLTVGLYKGKALTQFFTDGVVSVSGNAQLANNQILITGDCTITIS